MKSSLSILSTRTLSLSRIQEVEALGFRFIIHDFISKYISTPQNNTKQSINKNIILTSKTGVNAFLQMAKEWRLDINTYHVFCISQSTKELALTSGLKVVSSAPHASAIADEILKHKGINAVTHISSNQRRHELSEKLEAAAIKVQDLIGYRTEFTPKIIHQSYDAILFFSPSAVDSFLSQNELQQAECFCIGNTTGRYARQIGYQNIYVSDTPTEDALVKTIVNHYSKIQGHVKE